MSLHRKIEAELEVKLAADKFHELFSFRPHHISNMTPDHIQGVDLHEGEWGKPGKVIFWNYVHDGVPMVAKERVEVIDDVNNLSSFRVIEGDLLKEYKDFLITIQATPKGEGGSLVKWTFEYEKLNPDVPDPQSLLDLAVTISKGIDDHHVTAGASEMSLHGKMEAELEVKLAADKFHEVLSFRPHHISNMTPDHIQGVDLHEGEWGKQGKVIFWNYVHDGVPKVAKERVEVIDDVNNLSSFRVIEGDLLKEYKDFLFTVQATPKGEGGSLVKWTLEYEKLRPDVPEPQSMLDFVVNVSKGIDDHHITAGAV